MFKRLVLCLFLLAAAASAAAIDYTDIYNVPLQDGYGFNVVQSDNFLFVTFFVYGPDGKPTWYTANLTGDVNGNFSGPLYAHVGTFYGVPWNPLGWIYTQVGAASFLPNKDGYTATLSYTVTTPTAMAGSFTKTIQRQTLTVITLGPRTYFGGQAGAYSGCSSGTNNGTYTDAFDLQVTQTTSGDVTFEFSYESGLSCTLKGTLVQHGRLYIVPNVTYTCSDGLNTNAIMSEIKATSLGIEGRISAPSVGGGCREDAAFGGPRQ